MGSMPMPRDLSEDTLALWLQTHGGATYVNLARAVRALVEAKVREAVDAKHDAASICDKGDGWIEYDKTDDAIVARVMGEEAPRG